MALFVAWSMWLYATAPVDALRGRLVYLPPYSKAPREAGLGMPDNLQLRDLPESLIFATMVGEDIDFATDHGVRPNKIAKNVVEHLRNGGRLSGGSTLTQQVVKNAFTGTERTLSRKYVEAIYALRMEHDFTKEEIFTLYVNMAEVAPGTYGYRAGAELYFGKEPAALTDVEAVVLVNALPSPKKRAAWLREGTPDRTVLYRTYALLAQTRLVEGRYDVGVLSGTVKEHVFTDLLREREPHDLTPDEVKDVLERSQRDAKAFVRAHAAPEKKM